MLFLIGFFAWAMSELVSDLLSLDISERADVVAVLPVVVAVSDCPC